MSVQAGFNPATFTSSRGKRANLQQQNVADFLDEDELEELGEKGLQAKAEYDTFQTDSTAKSHTQAADQAAARHGLNLFPEEALKPVVNSIGVQLLQKMGWKQVCTSYLCVKHSTMNGHHAVVSCNELTLLLKNSLP